MAQTFTLLAHSLFVRAPATFTDDQSEEVMAEITIPIQEGLETLVTNLREKFPNLKVEFDWE